MKKCLLQRMNRPLLFPISAPKGAESASDRLTNPSNGMGLPEGGGAAWMAQRFASLVEHRLH